MKLKIPYTWEERRPVLLDSFLYVPPVYDKHHEWQKTPLFADSKPIVIEYCSGNGEWICRKAKNEPDVHWIAVEKRFDRSRKIWGRLKQQNLPNLVVVCGEALTFTKFYMDEKSVSKIYVNFPDPWPKLRHAKHRLVRPEFLEEVEKILLPKAKAIFTTDDPKYAEQMQEIIQWKKLQVTTDISDFGSSYFLDLWKQKGCMIYQMEYEYDHTSL
ncbi:MAG TPA: tRNA (guanosine(46)-N7)-methyltransferase TrmB [Chlamydiales bacterium]|nr:tRNA (guanosine(46)-N7)-methyltransferase TrmB [Chlamydiales bacterium]